MTLQEFSILIVDDDEVSRIVTRNYVGENFQFFEAGTKNECLKIIQENHIDITILDLYMPDVDRFELLEKIRAANDAIFIIMLTGAKDIPMAVEAIKLGAEDYIIKEQAEVALKPSIRKCIRLIKERALQNAYIKELSPHLTDICIPQTPIYEALFNEIRAYAQTDLNILILGETGTGKEVITQYIHQLSGRPGPLITLDCASISPTILESELFGHVKGAFTDAYTDKPGKIEMAHKGSLFLDELENIPANIQAKLLRVLETHRLERIGDIESRLVDFRLIAATNENLEIAVRDGLFRRDLYFRLNQCIINVPPLRESIEAVPGFIDHFIHIYNKKYKKDFALSPEDFERFMRHDWPGNIRELKNEIFRLVSLSGIHGIQVPARSDGLKTNIEQIERVNIEKALKSENFNISRAARMLGLKRSTLQFKIKKHNISLSH